MIQTKKLSKKAVISLFLCVVILLSSLLAASFVAASAYKGNGTKENPYLVTSVEQLDNMRNNLSAHYKLANTIDLSSCENFEPIGRLDNPFTGSFTCELNGDKTPKYVIKNLKIVVAETAYVAANASKWEAGLFGCVNGSTISGIYLLDVYVRNEVQGDNQGAVIYGTYKPGMDEMNSAALVGQANSAVIKNCGSTGKIDSKSNHCGGLIGRATDTTIMDCYSTINVKSSGKWNMGGLLGSGINVIIERCFATGKADCGQSQSGGLAGFIGGGSVTDCYSLGNATAVKQSSTAFFFTQQGYKVEVENCFALGTADKNDAQGGTITAKNCFAKSGTTHNMTGFTAASVADIKNAFANLPNWDVSGEYPTLITIGIVKDGSAYQPGEKIEGSSSEENSSSDEISTSIRSGWVKESGKWVYYKKATSEWIYDGGKWYHFDARGFMEASKWMKDSVGWVFLGSDGAMKTNAWVRDSIGWCYVGSSGYAVTNCWKKDSVGWCYLNSNGSMTKNAWVKDGGKWYYLNSNGYMVTNTSIKIGGKIYKFNASGVCTNP